MEKVSIIVPTHNRVEKLKRALDSILKQTYSEIEVIVVDDGSTDSTWDVLKKYQEKDKRIIAIHQENKGASVARNVGIQKATGTYVNFVDDDDFIEKDIIEKLVEKIKKEKVDLLRYNCYYSTNRNKKEAIGKLEEFENKKVTGKKLEEVVKKIITEELLGQCVLFLIPRELLLSINKGNLFDKRVRYMEDELASIELICSANSVYFWNEPGYYYYYMPDREFREKKFYQDYLKVLNSVYPRMKNILKKHGKLTDEMSDLIDVKWLNTIVDHFALIEKADPNTNKTERLRLIAELDYPKEQVESEYFPLKFYNETMIRMLQKEQFRKLYWFNKARRIVTRMKRNKKKKEAVKQIKG